MISRRTFSAKQPESYNRIEYWIFIQHLTEQDHGLISFCLLAEPVVFPLGITVKRVSLEFEDPVLVISRMRYCSQNGKGSWCS